MTTSKNDIAIGRDFPKKVIPLIEKSKKFINIMVYDWGWYPNEIGEQIQIFNSAIVRAHNRGVKVNVIVQRRLIKVILNQLGINVTQIHTGKIFHVKLMIIDNEMVIIGSHNYTKNAFNINHEASVIIQDEATIMKFQNYFSSFLHV